MRATKFWEMWKHKTKKALYLEEQYRTILGFQCTELVSDTFQQIKKYTQVRKMKKAKNQEATQVYLYKLGKRVFDRLDFFAKERQ